MCIAIIVTLIHVSPYPVSTTKRTTKRNGLYKCWKEEKETGMERANVESSDAVVEV